jgi:hypothetical protein
MRKCLFVLFVLILVGFVSAEYPPTPSAFYGSVNYEDGGAIPDGYVVTAELNGVFSASSVVKDGRYGYGSDTLIVLVYGASKVGGTVEFYVNGEKANEDALFVDMGVTELDLTVDSPPSVFVGCGDGIVNDGENCSSCPSDVGACVVVDGSSSGGGGSGGGGGGSGGGGGGSIQTITQMINSSDGGKENGIVNDGEDDSGLGFLKTTTEEVKPSFFSAITGAVIGGGATSWGIAVVFIALIVGSFGVISIRRRRKAKK